MIRYLRCVVVSGSQRCTAHLRPNLQSPQKHAVNTKSTAYEFPLRCGFRPNPITQRVRFVTDESALVVKIFVLAQNRNVSARQKPPEDHLFSSNSSQFTQSHLERSDREVNAVFEQAAHKTLRGF